MSKVMQIFAVLVLLAARAHAEPEALAVIDKAIKAHGGEANLGKFKTVSVKREGKHRIENSWWDSVAVVTVQMPDKIRFDSEVRNPNGGMFSLARIVKGDKGWQIANSKLRELRDVQVTQILDEMYAPWIASLVPLTDKGFEFSLVGESTVDDKPALGVAVSRKDRPNVNLYFEKKTGLLLKSERRMKDATGQEFNAESYYRDYKAFGGVLWATKRIDHRDGKEIEEDAGKFEFSDYQAIETLDEKLFVRP